MKVHIEHLEPEFRKFKFVKTVVGPEKSVYFTLWLWWVSIWNEF